MKIQKVEVVIVGAGFAGMYSLYRMLESGLKARVIEAGDNVGGTWYWNRYPGARCDVESMEYSYSFDKEIAQNWEWSERYATQPEILRYANHVADKFGLRRHISFETWVQSAHFLDETGLWRITTSTGEVIESQFCIMATGCLSSINKPEIPGVELFKGNTYHTGQWPHKAVDFSGRTVGIIGTGSSSIQSIPLIAAEAKHLTVFQRTANFSIPAHNRDLDPAYISDIKADYDQFRAENKATFSGFGARRVSYSDSVWDADEELRNKRFEERWSIGGLGFLGAFGDLSSSLEANNIAAEFIRQKIRGIVQDPSVAELLCPTGVVGCKRVCVDTNYYATYNRDNVTLVSVKDHAIDEITANGIKTNGREYQFDDLIFATGFDAMTGSLLRIDIRGRQGLPLAEKWAAGPLTYLGLATSGFPNLFTISGPGSPSVLSNMIVTIEQHVNWITDCINHMKASRLSLIEAAPEAEENWVAGGNAIADQTLFPRCNSWYLGANVPGKPRVFMPFVGGIPAYFEVCNNVVESGYQGFILR